MVAWYVVHPNHLSRSRKLENWLTPEKSCEIILPARHAWKTKRNRKPRFPSHDHDSVFFSIPRRRRIHHATYPVPILSTRTAGRLPHSRTALLSQSTLHLRHSPSMAMVSSFHGDARHSQRARRHWGAPTKRDQQNPPPDLSQMDPRSSGRNPPQLDWPLAWLRQSPRQRPQVPGGCDRDRHTVGQLRTESVAAKFDFGTLMFTMEPGRHILEVRTICLYSFPCYAFSWPYLPLKHHSFYGSRVYIVKKIQKRCSLIVLGMELMIQFNRQLSRTMP
jgi:hypothetical protein